jgi:hypothetical protein
MSDDQGMTDDQSTGILSNIDAFDFQDFDNDNDTLNDISPASMTDKIGSRSLLMPTSSWTQSLSLGTNNPLVDGQMQAPRYLEFNGIDSSDYSVTPDDATENPALGNGGFTNSRIFDRPMMATNNSFLSDSTQDFNGINPVLGLAGSYSALMTCATPQNVDASALKKRKTSAILESKEPAKDGKLFDSSAVLNLLFKYTQDLTMTQMLHIAEDTGCKSEFVVSSYWQYRTTSSGLVDYAPSIGHSAFAFKNQSKGGMQAHVGNGGESDDSVANDTADKDMIPENDRGEEPMKILDHNVLERSFQCPVSGCRMSFSRQGDLNRHSKKHRPPEHPCKYPNCDKSFYRKDKLREHWEKEHRDASRPSDLSSSRPRKDPDQDGNSRSNDLSKSNGSGSLGQSSGRSTKSRNSKNPGPSGSGCASDAHDGSSQGNSKNSEAYLDYNTENSESVAVLSDADTLSDVNSDTEEVALR